MADGWVDFVAGTVGGFAGKLFDYPFDTVKVLLQTQNIGAEKGSTPKYAGAWDCLQTTVKEKGFRGLYTGMSSPLLGSCAENAVLFTAYGSFKRMLGETPDHKLSLFQLATAGSGAGMVVSFVLTPFELIKCRLQVTQSIDPNFRAYKGPIDCVKQTLKNEGVPGLFRGNASMLAREVPGNFAWYGVYEAACAHYIPEGGTKADVSPTVFLGAGALSGVSYWTAFYPADTVKSQIQTNPEFSGAGFLTTMRSIYQREGIAGLYRGWGITVLRAAPAHALIFYFYEMTTAALTQ
jgi:hypothetical protein